MSTGNTVFILPKKTYFTEEELNKMYNSQDVIHNSSLDCPVCKTRSEKKTFSSFSYDYCPTCKEDVVELRKKKDLEAAPIKLTGSTITVTDTPNYLTGSPIITHVSVGGVAISPTPSSVNPFMVGMNYWVDILGENALVGYGGACGYDTLKFVMKAPTSRYKIGEVIYLSLDGAKKAAGL